MNTIQWKPKNRQELKTAVDVYIQSPDQACEQYGDISQWDVSAVTDMRYMFYHAISFNGDISRWDVSAVTIISSMFYDAKSYTGVFHKEYYVCGKETTNEHYDSITIYTNYFTRMVHIKQNTVLLIHCCSTYPYTIYSEFIRHTIGNELVKVLNPRYTKK